MENRIPVLAVVGPTASGKSRLAVELAARFSGEVVSADSMQIYRGIQIGTAKPTQEEMGGIPHHLIDCVDLSVSFSVADYVKKAQKCIAEISQRGKLPVIAGGTGLYVRSLLQNIQFSDQADHDPELRKQLQQKAEIQGADSLVAELSSFDPDSAERIDPHNLPRLIRAIEIYRVTGRTMTQHLKESRRNESPYRACQIGLNCSDREFLYRRINDRVDQMMQQGLEEEARAVYSLKQVSKTALQAIGYKEFFPYFRGECSLSETVEQIKRESRRYAKRQLTWFRRDSEINWIDIDRYPNFEKVACAAEAVVKDVLFSRT